MVAVRPARPSPIPTVFLACAGLFGTAGVGLSAAAAHLSGATQLAPAGSFLLLHATALVALAGLASRRTVGPACTATGLLMVAGTVLFSGALALSGLFGVRPVPLAAPAGGLVLMAGWLALPLGLLGGALRRRYVGVDDTLAGSNASAK